MVAAFAAACGGRDFAVLLRLLDPDVVLRNDGGGVVSAARRPIVGADRVARFFVGIGRTHPDSRLSPVSVNGWPGLLSYRRGALHAVMAFTVADGR